MKRVEAPCPSCGASVEFKVSSSLVTVCGYCQSVVARGDAKLEDFGKVARIVPLASPMSLNVQGLYRNKSFEVVGHVQYEHAAGGVWNEWYAAFPGDRWGWLAEAQGKIYLLFKRKPAGDSTIPASDGFELGETLNIEGIEPLTVAEIGEAKVLGAEGEMPFTVRPGASHGYVDLAGGENAFATIEYDADGKGTLYLGQQVTLEDLGIAPASGAVDADVLKIASLQVACPHCGGSLTLHAPDRTERVVCPFCDSMLDAQQGNLKYLQTLEVNKRVAPLIPIGSTGNLRGQDYTIIGFMQRSVTFDRDYFWTEYLLYSPEAGFRWLVHSDRHWSFVNSASAGDFTYPANHKREITFKGMHFKIFQNAKATVRHVLGEFYWKVEVGESVQARDFVRPPFMVSVEQAVFHKVDNVGEAREISYSIASYLPHDELEKAFGIHELPRAWGVAPNQPKPVELAPMMLGWLSFAAVLLVINFLAAAGMSFGKVDQGWFWAGLFAVSVIPGSALIYSHSFEVRRWQDSDFSPYNTE